MKQILILLLWLPMLAACKKNELNALPPATQEGRNTFGCLVNGKAWVPKKGGLFTDPPVEGAFYRVDRQLNLWVQATNTDGSRLDFWVENPLVTGEYSLQHTTGIYPTVYLPRSYGLYYQSGASYMTTSQYVGKVVITRTDTIRGIISGTFEFTGHSAKTGQTISITEGRFDVGPR